MKQEHLVRRTILVVFITLLFSFMAGAVVIICGLNGAIAKFVQALFIWASSAVVILFYKVRKKSLSELGFCKLKKGALKDIYWAIPCILISLSVLVVGVSTKQPEILLANLFLACAVGFTEEIYLRGIVCNLWSKRGVKSAVFVSSALYAMAHLMNLLNGAELRYTILQITFVFFNGIVLALIMLITKSIWPCIILHLLHDLCALTVNNIPSNSEITILVIWVGISLIYIFLMLKRNRNNLLSRYKQKI